MGFCLYVHFGDDGSPLAALLDDEPRPAVSPTIPKESEDKKNCDKAADDTTNYGAE
jgi:hypothetical protein